MRQSPVLRVKRLPKSLCTIDAYGTDEYKPTHASGSGITSKVHGPLNIDVTEFIKRIFRFVSDQMHASRTVHNNRNILDYIRPVIGYV